VTPPTSALGVGAPLEPAVRADRWWSPPGAVACLIVAALLAAAIAWPVLQAPTERIFGNEIVGRYHDPYTMMRWYGNPTRGNLHTQPATDWPGALAAKIAGGGTAYNTVVLATFPFAALFAYWLAFRVTGSVAGSWLAALVYAFAPFHLAHAAYHPHIAQVHWLPLYLLALWLALERATWRRLALVAASLALVGLSNYYFGLIAIALTPVALWGGWHAARRGGAPGGASNLARVSALLALVAVGGWLYVRAMAPAVLARPESLAFPSADVARYTARWPAYFVPPVEHPLFGDRARAFWDRRLPPGDLLEQQLTIGIGLTLLAGVALGLWWRDRAPAQRRYVPALAVLAAAAFFFSLPPEWHLLGFSFRGPSGWLYELAPMFRAHARFGVVVLLAVSLLAAIGLAALLGRRQPAARAAAGALLALALFELTPFPPFRGRDVLPTPAHRWLRAQGGGAKVLDCVSSALPSERGVPALFGGGLVQLPANGDCSESELAGKLAAQRIELAIVRRDSLDGEVFAHRKLPPGLRLVREFETAWIVAVEAPPAPVHLEVGDGFWRRQRHDDRSYRWMGESGAIRVVNASGAPQRVALEVSLHAMPFPRTVRYELESGSSGEVGTVGLEPSPFLIGPFEIAPRGATLRLTSVEPASVADSVLHNGDLRELTVALWEWKIGVSPPNPDVREGETAREAGVR
jgi:hypothetical protein